MLFDCFATILQSQLVGLGKSNLAPTTNPGVALEYNTGPGLVQIQDAVSSSGRYKTQTGSMIPMFANVFGQWSGRGVAFARCAVGGTSVLQANSGTNGNWSPTGTLFDESITRIQAMLAAVVAAGHTVASLSIISSGGYADAKGGNDLASFKAANIALLTRYRTALSRPTLKVYQELMYAPIGSDSEATRTNCLFIRDRMVEAVAETPGLEIAFTDSSSFTYPAWLNADKLHYNQAGLNLMGKRFAEYIAADMGFSEPGVTPVDPAGRTSLTGRRLMFAKPRPPLPRDFGLGTTRWAVPIFTTAISIEGEGPGGKGGNGAVGLKGGAAGGGAYSKLNALAVTPGEEYDVTVTAGGSEAPCTVTRVSDGVIVWRAAAGKNGINGNPNGDGAGGLAADCIGDVKTSGQNGGVSAIDNGGNAAAPLGGAGGVYPAAGGNGNPGAFPGGGGSAAGAGSANVGGPGGTGLVRITAA